MAAQVVIPGQPLYTPPTGSVASFRAGTGTYARGGTIYSSLRGSCLKEGGIISVLGKDDQQSIPEPNSTVIGTITRITRQAATLSLLTVDGKPCRPDFVGVIRAQDVRQTAKDSVKVSWLLPLTRRPSLTILVLSDLVLLSTRRCSAGKGREWCLNRYCTLISSRLAPNRSPSATRAPVRSFGGAPSPLLSR